MTRRFLVLMLTGLATMATALTELEARSEPTGPAAFIESIGNDLLDVLRSPQADHEVRKARLRDLFTRAFDVPAIGKFVLGRHWREATEAQRQEYLKLFREHVVDIYAQRFVDYSGETFEIVRERELGPNDVSVQIEIVRPEGPPLLVEFRVTGKDDGMRIIDTVVEGVSLIVTKRDEFSAVVKREGVDGLIERLRQIIGAA